MDSEEDENYFIEVNGGLSVAKLQTLFSICGSDSLVTKESNGYAFRTSDSTLQTIKKIPWVKDVYLYTTSNIMMK
jgi:hypothetical protein